MTQHCRPMRAFLIWGASAAAVLSALSTQAAVLGHSRVISSPDQPLRIVVQLKDVSPTERDSLTAMIAPSAAWQEAGLQAPVDLSSFRIKTLAGSQPDGLQLVLESSQIAAASVIDVLMDINTNVSTQRHQVSVLQAPLPAPIVLADSASDSAVIAPRPIAIEQPSETPRVADTHRVRSGQTLSQLARQHRSPLYSDQQFMAAVLQANPQAFIHGNLNLIRTGTDLTLPTADAIALVSPQQARQLYQTHLQWFDDYRQRLAQGSPISPMADSAKAETQLESSAELAQTDRLQLDSTEASVAQADHTMAQVQELAHMSERLTELESPVDAAPASLAAAATAPDIASNEHGATSEQTGLSQQNTASDLTDSTSTSTSSEPQDASWLAANGLWLALVLLVLAVLGISWFLRRAHSSRLDVLDELSPSAARMRDKLEKNNDNSAPQTDEVEFREIK